jgi:ribose 5-phosphate isomerase B
MKERIVISSDHAGFDLKCHLKPFIESLGYAVEDIGTYSKEPVDYPEYTFKAAKKVISGECSRGIVFCGTGQGDAMVANKVPGIRAALCWDEFTARMSRAHNDANVLVLGGWVTGHRVAEEMVRIWLSTPFDGGRHERRIKQIYDLERQMELARGKIYDITQTVRPGMLMWPGDQKVLFKQMEYEGVSSLTQLDLSAHTGTHVDAPAHIISGGKGADQLDLEQMTGLARVCHLPGVQSITRIILSDTSLGDVSRLLLRTSNSALLETSSFNQDYVSLTEDAAEYIVEKGIRFLALDYLSVDEFHASIFPVHRVLMNAGVVIAEGVDLSDVPAGDYEMLCMPLKLNNCDGAPARIVLRTL